MSNWSSDVKAIMHDLNLSRKFNTKSVVNLSSVKNSLQVMYNEKWQGEVQNVRKLPTYSTFKESFVKESYMTINLKNYERSLLCQFRFGI